MNLQHLRTFVAVWRTGSISQACEELGLTQPAASGQLKSLETELGHTLFRRHSRGVTPTVIADQLARAIGDRLDRAEAAFERLRARSSMLEGTVHFAGPAEFVGECMPSALNALLRTGLNLRVRLGGRDAIYRWFADEEIELAVTASEPIEPAIGYEPAFTERLMLVGAPRLELGGEPQSDWPWLAYDEDLSLLRTYLSHLHPAVEAIPVAVAGSLTLLRDLAIAGSGVAVLPDYLCRAAIATGSLKLVEKRQDAPENTLFLAWRKSALRHPRTVLARDRCRDELRRLKCSR